MDDLETVLNNANGHQFLAIVATVHHERVDETLNDGALSFAKPLGSKTASRVRQILGLFLLHANVVSEGHIRHVDLIGAPLVKELGDDNVGNFSANGGSNIFIPIVGHPGNKIVF